MSSIINTNLSSLNAQNNLSKSQASLTTSLQRLSTGLRINSAKDDAAGLAISERMSSQITGLNQAARNSNDGISMAQTAEGALGSISDSLQRIRELAVQSANGSNTDADRASMQQEASQLLQEVDRVAGQTKFNGRTLLDGSLKNQQFQVGANVGETVSFSVGSAQTKNLGSSSASAITTAQNSGHTALKEGAFSLNGVAIGPSMAGADTASTAEQAASAIAKAAAVNAKSAESGVTATVNATEVAGSAMTAPSSAASGKVTLNGVDIDISVSKDTASTRASIVAAINAKSQQTGVTAEDSGSDKGGVKLSAADGRNIEMSLTGVGKADTGLNVGNAGSAMTAATITPPATKTISLNGNSIDLSSVTAAMNGAARGTAVAAAINGATANTGISAAADATTGIVKLTNANGADIKVDLGSWAAGDVGLDAGVMKGTDTSTGSITLNSDKDIVVSSNLNGAAGSGGIKDAGLAAGTYSSQTAYASTNSTTAGSGTAIAAGDFTINGTAVGASVATADTASAFDKANSGIAKAAAINAISDKTGVTATVNATQVDGTANAMDGGASSTTGKLVINGVSTGQITTGTGTASNASNRKAVVDAINAISGQTGVVATDSNDDSKGVTLSAADGRNVTIYQTDAAGTGAGTLTDATTGLHATALTTPAAGGVNAAETTAATFTSTITLSSASEMKIENGSTGNGTKALNLAVGTYGAGRSGESLDKLDISTVDGANKAIVSLDNALKTVNSARSNLGAIQNRFSAVVSNLQSTSENLTASRSRIRDADFASETANMTRGQILQQAGTAMLAQANSLPNGVLSLLRG